MNDQRSEMPWPPASVQIAEEIATELADRVAMIQAQLANKNHTDEDGRRLTEHQYHEWRARAVWALNSKVVERRRLTRWILAQKHKAAEIELGADTPKNVVELVGALAAALKDGIAWDDMTPREQGLVIMARDWIRTKGVPILERARARENGKVAS